MTVTAKKPTSPPRFRVKRVYDPPASSDGIRLLVDRLWPRGLSKQQARIDGWIRDVAPSDGLRRWFGHDPSRWDEFRARYFAELDGKHDTWAPLLARARRRPITLLYAAKDEAHNNAVALKEYLEDRSRRAMATARGRRDRGTRAGLKRSSRARGERAAVRSSTKRRRTERPAR